jgi:hypothetical protein
MSIGTECAIMERDITYSAPDCFRATKVRGQSAPSHLWHFGCVTEGMLAQWPPLDPAANIILQVGTEGKAVAIPDTNKARLDEVAAAGGGAKAC